MSRDHTLWSRLFFCSSIRLGGMDLLGVHLAASVIRLHQLAL